MTNIVRVFDFEDQAVRVVEGPDGEPWFVGKDVCRVLGIANHNDALSRLDEDEKGVGNTDPLSEPARGGGAQATVIISEAGVYRLIFTSRKEEAERFKRWLAHDVLPELRRTGRFEMEQPPAELGVATPLDEWRTWLMCVGVVRRLYGHATARAVYQMSPLPLPKANDDDDAAIEVEAIDCFLRDWTVRQPGGRIPAGELYARYCAWSREREDEPETQTKFGRELSKRGVFASPNRDGYRRDRVGLAWIAVS